MPTRVAKMCPCTCSSTLWLSTRLHTQKAYTHTGTSSPQILMLSAHAYMHFACMSRFGVRIGWRKYLYECTPFEYVNLCFHYYWEVVKKAHFIRYIRSPFQYNGVKMLVWKKWKQRILTIHVISKSTRNTESLWYLCVQSVKPHCLQGCIMLDIVNLVLQSM